MLHTATVTVKFVNPPKEGKKKGSIKGANDEFFFVWADKLGQYEKGKTYEVEYEESDFNGQTYRTIKNVKPSGNGSAAQSAAPATSGAYYKPTSPVDSERMFVCAILAAGIKSGQIKFGADTLVPAIAHIRTAYKQTLGRIDDPTPATRRAELDDEIPFN